LVAELAAIVIFVIAIGAERLHARRVRESRHSYSDRLHKLHHGQKTNPALCVLALTGLCWGLVTLMLLTPKIHVAEEIDEADMQHLLIVLDVSPSMRLKDAGQKKDQSRMKRASVVMNSFFERVYMHRYRTSVVAVYNEAKRVVEETKDMKWSEIF